MPNAAASLDFSKTVVATIEGRPVTQGELAEAFDWVADRANWKLPVDCTLVLSPRQTLLVREAVPFFTGCVATITPGPNGSKRVEADGYYKAIGA